MKSLKVLLILTIVLLSVAGLTSAQDDVSCLAVAEQILSEVKELCAGTGRNQICYGHGGIEAIAYDGADPLQFAQAGDIADLVAIETLRLSPMDLGNDAWGVAFLRLQLNLSDSQPAQNATVLLIGKATLSSAVSAGSSAHPLQAFYLTTGASGDSACASAPSGGLIVQTPRGAGEVTFSVNGANVSLGSTVYFRVNDDRILSVTPVEGAARVASMGRTRTVVAGTRLDIPLNEQFIANGEPLPPISYVDNEDIYDLPLDMFEREIEIADPLTDEELAFLIDSDEYGVFCGEAPLPSCEDYPWLEDWEPSDLEWGDDDIDWLYAVEGYDNGYDDMEYDVSEVEYDDSAEHDDSGYEEGVDDTGEYDDTEIEDVEFDDSEGG